MSRIRFAAEITASPEDLEVLLGALGPEQEDEFPGVELDLAREAAGRLRLVIAGERAPPVRAAVNATLGWVRTVEDILDAAPAPATEEA